jgi:hypothetical protein
MISKKSYILFVSVIFFILILQSWTKADDIRDFEIEGISIGDKLLEHFSKKEINSSTDESASDRIYIVKTFFNLKYDLYEAIQITYKNSDQNKTIVGIGGVLGFPNNINSCKKEMYYIVSQIENIFPNAIKKDWGKYKMPTNEGHYFPITFDLKDMSRAMVSCQDWNKSSGIDDNLKVSLFAADYSEYLKRQN